MPQVDRPIETIPDDFDPEKHCGAVMGDTVCMRPAGWGVQGLSLEDRPGSRCVLHRGVPALVVGVNTMPARRRRTKALLERVEELRSSRELLTLEEQIATMRALWEKEVEAAAAQSEAFDAYMQTVYEALDAGLEPPPVPPELVPKVDTRVLDSLARLVKTEYEMRYAKRFSVPVEEVAQMLLKLAEVFNTIAAKYGIPVEAREEFAEAVVRLRVQHPSPRTDDQALEGVYERRALEEGKQ